MNIKLIQGEFYATDALDLITKLIHIKIKYHEAKIANNKNKKEKNKHELIIKQLQESLFNARNNIEKNPRNINLESQILMN